MAKWIMSYDQELCNSDCFRMIGIARSKRDPDDFAVVAYYKATEITGDEEFIELFRHTDHGLVYDKLIHLSKWFQADIVH